MARYLYRLCVCISRKSPYILLALSWLLGLVSGAVLFRCCNVYLLSVMPSVLVSRLSIVNSLLSLLLPFLFSAVAVYLSCPAMLWVVCFAKALCFGYISCGVFLLFPDCGWLVHALLLFSDQICVILLLVYWQRHISGYRRFCIMGICAYVLVLCSAVYVDVVHIAPFLNRIMTI